ncbi:olfactory receptor 5F1-like [Tiliqua scincoides]|uniref:olfactory receptor 5F1-like n=1 Tax=Tiliqua scincoides TaxID=71010 RepID=UPI003461B7DA
MRAENKTSLTEFILTGLSEDRKMQVLLFVVFLLMYSLTIVGNLLVIILVQVSSSLHTPMYFFLTHLSSVDICFITSTMPQTLAHLLSGNGVISFTRCAVQMYITTCLGCTECILLGAMAYDRYLAICSPLAYASVMDRWRQLLLVSFSWAGGILLGVINVTCTICLPFCGTNRINHFFCEQPVVFKYTCADARFTQPIIFVVSALILMGPLSVIIISYVLTLYSVFQMKSAAGRHRAFSTCASHLMVVVLFYGALIFMYMRPWADTATEGDKQIAVFYIIVTPLLNPVIYTLRNKNVHGAVRNVLQKWGMEQKRCVSGSLEPPKGVLFL